MEKNVEIEIRMKILTLVATHMPHETTQKLTDAARVLERYVFEGKADSDTNGSGRGT